MMPVERQRRIVELVNERGSIRVTEISQLFDVTPETARRDLDILEGEGRLRRSHGGAVRAEDNLGDVPFFEREQTNTGEKMAVAKTAARFIQAGDKVVFDASSTAFYLARVIPDMPVTVLTNSVRVVQELSSKEKIEVICTGGVLRAQSMSFVGPLAEETLSKYHVNKAFISCKAVHVEHGASEANELQAIIKRHMRSIAEKTYLMVDYTKFGMRDLTHVFDLNELDCIITNAEIDSDTVHSLRGHHVVLA